MSNRTIRVNELIQRELSDILHRRYQSEAVALTITEIRVAPDLRDARIFVSIFGNDDFVEKKLRWFRAILPDLRLELGRRIVLKFMPRFTVALDKSTARGNRILAALDELGPVETTEDAGENESSSTDKESGKD
ncbi:MAG: ribosome-binding factor A [Nibricoccus sp.]